jgi:hypothetical protein
LNEMVSVLTKVQVARSLLVDPLNFPDGEPSSSSKHRERVIQNI